jgi:hypothetical protein
MKVKNINKSDEGKSKSIDMLKRAGGGLKA